MQSPRTPVRPEGLSGPANHGDPDGNRPAVTCPKVDPRTGDHCRREIGHDRACASAAPLIIGGRSHVWVEQRGAVFSLRRASTSQFGDGEAIGSYIDREAAIEGYHRARAIMHGEEVSP